MSKVFLQRCCWGLLVLSLLLLVPVCRLAAKNHASGAVLVAVAADVAAAMQEIGVQFTNDTGITLHFHVGSAGQLAQQVERGAPIDLFAAANVAFIEALEQQGRIAVGSKALYARGRLILWWLPAPGVAIERLADLAQPAIKRIALANPLHAPYGMAARQALQAVGLWEPLQPKLVLGENVLQAFQYAATGNVDVALVSRSLSTPQQGGWLLVPEELHTPLVQALAVIQGSKHEAQARQLAHYITGSQGQAILQRYGFLPPPQEPHK